MFQLGFLNGFREKLQTLDKFVFSIELKIDSQTIDSSEDMDFSYVSSLNFIFM